MIADDFVRNAKVATQSQQAGSTTSGGYIGSNGVSQQQNERLEKLYLKKWALEQAHHSIPLSGNDVVAEAERIYEWVTK